MASVKLTDRAVHAAKAPDGERLEIFDQGCPGLVLRVAAGGRKTWVVRYRTRSGRQPRLTLGTYPALMLADARELAGDALKAAAKGSDPSADRQRDRREARSQPLKTLDDLVAAYFVDCRSGDYRARKRHKAESTIVGEEGLYRRHLKPAVGGTPLEDLTADALKRTLRDIARTAGVQGNRCHSLLSQLLNYSVTERRRLPYSPLAGVKKPLEETPRSRVLSDSELRAIWRGLDDPGALSLTESGKDRAVSIGEPVALALRLTTLLLQRRSEVAGMAVHELDLEQAVWVIPAARTKNRHEHVVPLPAEAVRLIRRALELAAEGLERRRRRMGAAAVPLQNVVCVFPSPRDPATPIGGGALTHAFNDLCAGLSIKDARVHDLRRTGATALTSERGGQRRFFVSHVLNHADNDEGARVTGVYDRNTYLAEKRAALAAWEALLFRIMRDEP